jgi:hypothetical protein
MSDKPSKPTQHEVDSLAAFIEAAEELQQEPFFGPDEKRTLGHDGKQSYCTLGDRFHFRSALVSFRRIWLAKEASNFYKICKIINKYCHEELCVKFWMQTIRDKHQQTEAAHSSNTNGLSKKDIVDLWLNAVFAHNNIAQKSRQPKLLDRMDFERYAKASGYAFFEYSFRMAVWEFGLCYLNLLRCIARPTLNDWNKKHGMAPSFEIGAPFGRGMEEITEDGVKITRKASTQYWNPETPMQKLERLLSRREFGQLGNILKQMNTPNLLDIINQSAEYEEVLRACGFQIELVAAVDRTKVRQDMAKVEVLALIPCHRDQPPDFDSVIYIGKRIVTQQGAIDFFQSKYKKLKQLLIQEPTPR